MLVSFMNHFVVCIFFFSRKTHVVMIFHALLSISWESSFHPPFFSLVTTSDVVILHFHCYKAFILATVDFVLQCPGNFSS